MLDGRPVTGTVGQRRRAAFEELHQAGQFARGARQAATGVATGGRADYKQLSRALDGALSPGDPFFFELEHARAALLLGTVQPSQPQRTPPSQTLETRIARCALCWKSGSQT